MLASSDSPAAASLTVCDAVAMEAGARVRGEMVGSHTHVGTAAEVHDGARVGDYCALGRASSVAAWSTIPPFTAVEGWRAVGSLE